MARRVAAWSDGHFNPVIFHGPYGFGKTHLLNALAWEAMQSAPDRRVVYITAERFTSTFVKAVQDRQTAAFKDELRNADLLLIDDDQFVAGKASTQEELFHTLLALVEDGRRVVMTADRSPAELQEMEPRLRSHLQAGLVCGIEPADRTLRIGILERKLATLAAQGRFVPSARPEVLQFLADRGRCPSSGEQVTSIERARRTNAVMMTCGTYDAAGEFAFHVGLPAKSGVGGGIVAVVPHVLTLCVWSPALDEKGNSQLGAYALHRFTRMTGLSVF